MKRFYTCLLLLAAFVATQAGSLDDIRHALEESSVSQVQEKVYIHTDNSCYFVGDTLWYKAYVVRADNLQPTDMSRILYVELLSPDGLLVERQTVIINAEKYTCGQFCLEDSLYSGYYELRAYTRWMLNFNVREHTYSTHDTWHFYNRQMAADYFRVWDGLYSRVFPVYSKPEQSGDYDLRRMYQRPKTRLPKVKKDDLVVTFYPEGGHLIEGVRNRVAFDITDQHGEVVNISGTVNADGQSPIAVKTEYMGRGSFDVTPTDKRLKAHFTFRGKQYTINLPKAERQGAAITIDGDRMTIRAVGLPQDRQYAVSVLCRGVLKHFEAVPALSGRAGTPISEATVSLPLADLPSGVADVTLFDSEGRIWADRLVFWKGEQAGVELPGKISLSSPISSVTTFAPYAPITLSLQVPEPGATFSLSVRDASTDDPSYNDGNIMTDLLLSSELRGFIAYPSHYFESDDAEHRRHLDLLMMVQGWRKYKWEELADTSRQMRYQPELTFTLEGTVYKMLSLNEVEPDEVGRWQDGVGMIARKSVGEETYVDPWAEEDNSSDIISTEDEVTTNDNSAIDNVEYGDIGNANDNIGVNHGRLKHEVLVEAEVYRGEDVVGSVQKTKDGGHFIFEIPPFYGDAFLNMKAYKEKDSLKRNMLSRQDAHVMDEDAFPDFYVKRDLFYPMFTHDYTFYEKHQPDVSEELLIDTLSELSMENEVYQLRNVDVKGRRRGRRAIDWNKPAYVLDAYDLYNNITDYGLSFGKLDMRQFPVQVCRYLYGNMNRYKSFHVDGRIDGATYYRNYSPLHKEASEVEELSQFRAHRTPQSVYGKLKLKRLQDIRVFSDYEPRTEDSLMVEALYSSDATVELVTIPDDGVQISFRDRHLVLHGFNAAEAFYQPDYSDRQPGGARAGQEGPADYRRTLFWTPNAVADENGKFTTTFYNNGKDTRIKISAAGITSNGRLVYY